MRFKCICIFENNMAKHKLKIKPRNPFNFEAIKAPFKKVRLILPYRIAHILQIDHLQLHLSMMSPL